MMVYLCIAMVTLLFQQAASVTYNCSAQQNRIPDNSDLTVDCGTSMIILEVNVCTAQWAGFDPSNLALNGQHNTSQCQGSIDTSKSPPVIRYLLPVNDSLSNPCRQSLQIVNEVPDQSGPFSLFSSIQSVIITGFIDTPRSSVGIISYSTDLYYHFSCRYPLEYLLNNTKIVASSVSVATTDNNGSFINTLSMSVYNDTNYTQPLVVPLTGLSLRTKVFVEVKATNLTGNFNVLLDHCFATPSPYNMSNSDQFSFFTGCSVDSRTQVTTNGKTKGARFNFEAFRFVQHRDQDKSSIYLHCILRLCEPVKCQEQLSSCGSRRRRSEAPFGSESPESVTVSVGPLFTAREVDTPTAAPYGGGIQEEDSKGDVAGLVVGIVLGTAGVALLVMGGWFVMKNFAVAKGLPLIFN